MNTPVWPRRSRRVVALVLAGAVLLPLSGQAELALPVLWQADLQTFTESGATVADITGDGLAEVVVAARDEIVAIADTGKELWRFRTRGRNMTYPAVLARDSQSSLVFAADTSGQFTCLDGAGHVVWQNELNGPSSWSAPVLCDLDANGTYEVIQTDETGVVWTFDAASGAARWQTKVDGTPVSPAVAGGDIAIVTCNGTLAVLDGAGAVEWTHALGGTSQTWGASAPAIFRGSDGGGRVVAASSEGTLYCFDLSGKLHWVRSAGSAIASTLSAGDMDADGIADLFAVTQLGVVHRFDETGKALWRIDTQGRSLAAGALIDLTGDGLLEYALSTQSGHLMVIDSHGALLFDRQFAHRTINVTPAFGDISAAAPGLEMIITGGEAGLIYCFGTGAPTGARASWTAYRGNEHKSGSWMPGASNSGAQGVIPGAAPSPGARGTSIAMMPLSLAPEGLIAGEALRFSVANPGQTPVVAMAICAGPDGLLQGAITRVFADQGELRLPIEAVSEGVYRFEWTLMDEAGAMLSADTRSLTITPLANERRLFEEASKSLEDTATALDSTNPLIAAGLRRERDALRVEMQESDPNFVRIAALSKRAIRLCAVATSAGALGPNTSLLPYEKPMWESRALNRLLPESAVDRLRIERRAALGEHEPLSLGVFNPLPRDVHARIVFEVSEGGPAVTLHRSVPTVTSLGEISWDALPELDESATLLVPSLESAEVWIDLDTHNVQPGVHTIAMRLLALNGAGVDDPRNPQSAPPPVCTIEIVLSVLPFELAPSRVLRLCAWARLEPGCVEDLLAHGNNVFVGPHATPQLDAQGKLASIDYSSVDAFLAPLAGHDVIVLLSGIPGLQGEVGSPAHLEQLEEYLDGLVSHLAEKGFGPESFAMYPVDEPAVHGWNSTNQYVAFAKAVKTVRPEIMVYMDGGGEAPLFEAMAPYTDIWCPAITMLAEDSPAMRIVRKDALHLWSYDCAYPYSRPAGPNIKNTNLVGQFRAAALFAFRHGATGIGYWCYNIGDDPWGRVELEYPLVYPGQTRPVTSRRWEAVREGVEDYRILAALRSRIDADASRQLPDAVRSMIDRLITVSLPRMIDPAYEEVRVGLGRDAIDFSNNDETIRAFREELIDCAEAAGAVESAEVTAP